MRILFLGGTGIISSACAQHAVEHGHEVTFLNRGKSFRSTPAGVETIVADARDKNSIQNALGDLTFDAVIDWIAFVPDHIKQDIEVFQGRTGQFVFISSASAYQTPPERLPVTEETPLENPFWEYSRNKIACEEELWRAKLKGFPMTIIRPSHTYDQTLLPFDHGYTVVHRMRQGKPVVVHGDGSSLWVLTNHRDFAKGFVPLLGNPKAIGEAVHITSDELLSWNQIYDLVAKAAGTTAKKVHVPSDIIATYDANWGDSLIGDKANSMIFDNSKLKGLVPGFKATIPFAEGAKEIMAWYDSDPARRKADPEQDRLEDELIKRVS